MRLLSPAKVNLFLKIIGRRSDGYHELASLFQALDIYDTLDMTLDDHDSLSVSDPTLPVDERNLVTQAVTLFRNSTHIPFSVKIHIEKRIPQQAGLGGGSSNAATALWGLNALLGSPFTIEELRGLASRLGSDVPFFLTSGTAYCTGRGEEVVEQLPLDLPEKCTVIKPDFGISTADVYRSLDLALLPKVNAESSLEKWLQRVPVFYNDLEVPAFSLMPKMKEIKQSLLDRGYENVIMSGSGSAFFCVGSGNTTPDVDEGLISFPVSFVNRDESSWYGI